MLFWPILGHFWCSVVILATFSNNLNNLKEMKNKNQKIIRLFQKISKSEEEKIFKQNPRNLKKSNKPKENP